MMAFCKARKVSELALTLIGGTLIESINELVFRHYLKTITTRIVRKLNPRDTKYIRNNLQCDNYAHTSNASNEMRYWIIESMHVEVKLLDQHRWTSDWGITQWPLSYTIDDSGKVGVREVRQDDLAFKMNASSRKVLKEVWFCLLITKPDRERSSVSRKGCPGMNRVPGWSRFTFGCHRSKPT